MLLLTTAKRAAPTIVTMVSFKVKPNTDLAKLEEKLSKWDDDHERIENRKMDGEIVEIISKLI